MTDPGEDMKGTPGGGKTLEGTPEGEEMMEATPEGEEMMEATPEGEEMEEDAEDTDSDSQDEDDDVQNKREEELKQKVKDLQKQLEGNNLYYDGHVNLIAVLRELFELEEARHARQRMSEVYPLTPELWLDWIRDEQKVCTSDEERQYIVELFERAVKDYTSVQLWVEYVMFMLGSGDVVATRAIGERALTAAGTHVAEGVLTWQVVLLVEKQIYAGLQKAGAIQSEEEVKEQEKQLHRIQGLLRRQMRVPLLNCDSESLLEEASEYFDGKVDSHMKEDLKKTQKKLNEKIPYEHELLRAENDVDKLATYRRYIAHTKETDNPAAVQSLYERAVTDHCLDVGLWEEYVTFIMHQFPGLDYVVLPVCERSQRNCPWSATLCELHITALQMFQSENEDITSKVKGALEKGLGCGIQSGHEATRMWMAYLIYLRRQIPWDEPHEPRLRAFKEAGEQAIRMIDEHFGEDGDIESKIPRFLSRIEAEFARDAERSREIWNDIIMRRNNNFKNAKLWLEFINIERSYGSEKHCRKLFRRALERVWDWVEDIGSAYQCFEQEVGTLETMEDFTKRYKDRMAIVIQKRAEDAAKLEMENQAGGDKSYGKKQKEKTNRREKNKPNQSRGMSHQSQESAVFKVPHPVIKGSKAFKQDLTNASSAFTSTPDSKSFVAPPSGFKGDVAPPPGFKGDVAPPPGFKGDVAPPPGFEGNIAPPPGFKDDVAPPPGFKGNIAPPPGFKGDVAPPPGFKGDVAPPPGFKSQVSALSKGSKREAEKSDDESHTKKIKIEQQYGVLTELDPKDELCTVFLSNLGFTTGKEDVIPVFSKCGEIADFRLVKDFKCRSKGFGYLVFETREAAVKSLELDRTLINERPVFVSPYDPDNQTQKFKYSSSQERDKLFVKGLPFSMTEKEIREAFEPHGEIKALRLVTYRNGHSKGTCYIDYNDVATAEKVQKAMDGIELEGKTISVVISDPSAKKNSNNQEMSVPEGGLLGGGNKGKKAAGTRGRSMFSLMPRALLRAPVTSADSPETSTTETPTKKMSNEDFRNMLLKK
nr:squamous cell carcinoma antigen recognized by T-cells 3-like isoform X1 [Procambarus clarkii]